jgi:hypothetical protein
MKIYVKIAGHTHDGINYWHTLLLRHWDAKYTAQIQCNSNYT